MSCPSEGEDSILMGNESRMKDLLWQRFNSEQLAN